MIETIKVALGARCLGCLTALKAHSPSADVLLVAKTVRELQADLLLAVGGGSVIDTAKVALAAVIDGRKTLDDLKHITNPSVF